MEVKFNDVSYTYNKSTPFARKALNKINFDFDSNKIYGLVGSSGSGKTTLLNLIDALMLPSEGVLTVGHYQLRNGVKINDVNKLRFDVGLVFQFPEEQFFRLTVKDEISFGMKYFNYKVDSIDKRVIEVLKLVGLDESYLERNPFKLSDGEKRRVAIASMLVFNPKIVMFDEPTVGLDNKGKKKLIEIIKRLQNRYHKTIIISTHDIDLLYELANHVIVLDKGEVVLEGGIKEVFDNIELLDKHHIRLPRILAFIEKVNREKKIKLEKHIDIRDLIKDIYRHV